MKQRPALRSWGNKVFNKKVKIYCARGMSGRDKALLVAEAVSDKVFFESAGFIVLDPVTAENVKAENRKLRSSKRQMDTYWFRDKQMIREANAVVDCTPHLKSFGSEHEVGLARYGYWKAVVRMFPKGELPNEANVAFYEDDFVCDSREEVVEYLLRTHGSYFKRLKWRLSLYRRCIVRHLIYKTRFWFQ